MRRRDEEKRERWRMMEAELGGQEGRKGESGEGGGGGWAQS